MAHNPTNEIVENGGKVRKTLKIVVYIKLLLGITIIILGGTCWNLLMSPGAPYEIGCFVGTGVWVGGFAIISAIFGIAATHNHKSICLLITYFVFCIITTLLMALLIFISSFYAHIAGDSFDTEYYHDNYHLKRFVKIRAGFGINVILALLAAMHFISCILASSLICKLWSETGCCNTNQQQQIPTVIFIQPQTGLCTDVAEKAIILKQVEQRATPIYLAEPPTNEK